MVKKKRIGRTSMVVSPWETSGLFLGPMPTKSFLDKFLFDPDTPKCPDVGRSFASLAGDKSYGAEKYDLFVSMAAVSASAKPR